jgi:hypothetical protein
VIEFCDICACVYVGVGEKGEGVGKLGRVGVRVSHLYLANDAQAAGVLKHHAHSQVPVAPHLQDALHGLSQVMHTHIE